MVKHTVAFFGCAEFPAEKIKRVWSTINDLIEDGTHRDAVGIRIEEEGCIRRWKTQVHSRCKRFLGCNEGFLLLCLPQERTCLAQQGRIQGSYGAGETWNKTMIIIHHPYEFLELPDGSWAWKFGDCIDFRDERVNSLWGDVMTGEINSRRPENTLVVFNN